MPNSPVGSYKNKVSYSSDGKKYYFEYSGDDYSMKYVYDLNKGASFNGIKLIDNDLNFYPSYFGGPGITLSDNREYFIWSENIVNENLKSEMIGDTIITEWIMKKGDEYYFHYQYKISIMGKTLIVRVSDLGKIKNYPIKDYASAFAFHLDRCENAIDPVVIGIPYLTSFNILYTNNLFTSIFFDWTKTNSSQIWPYEGKYSSTSSYFSQYALYDRKTNGKRNKLDETIYLTVSPELEEVLPNIPNPISEYKNVSINRAVFDNWEGGFNLINNSITKLKNSGIDSLWLIVHNWQNAGYDNKYPDVLPANSVYGGNKSLKEVRNLCKSFGYLFSLHENYTDYYPNASSYSVNDVALTPGKELVKAWKTETIQSYLLKPSRAKKYLIPFSTNIHNTFETDASFIDATAARTPSEILDYDYRVKDAGKFIGTLNAYIEIAGKLKKIHKGPVSSEGYNHFYYIGYYDDLTPQIETALVSSERLYSGYYNCLLVDFDLRKMHEKTMVHGVGYYERFFYKDNYWQYMGRGKDSALIYSATELAYGHGSFFSSLSSNILEQASLEYNYVYPLQLLYGNAKAVKILYNDNGRLITISDYIKKYPHTFDKFKSPDFLSQVFIEYDNGLRVYVNRHPTKSWKLNFKELNSETLNGVFNYHLITNGSDVLYNGNSSPGSNVTLPKSNGWFCYFPYQ
ncbi:MAG: DUF5696 domain-containing protein [bacterium]